MVDVFTQLPEYLSGPLALSVIGRAATAGVIDVRLHNLRSHGVGRHRSLDDTPFGGGPGMVMLPGPIFEAVESVDLDNRPLFLLDPAGRRFDQAMARDLAAGSGFGLLCGRYEGVDERVRQHLVDGEISVGDYVLAGGEAAALVVIEAVARLVPGVLGNDLSASDESFAGGLLEYPQYTRPADFRGWTVPEVLLSGDHGAIERWRRQQALERTRRRRPDLLASQADRDRTTPGAGYDSSSPPPGDPHEPPRPG